MFEFFSTFLFLVLGLLLSSWLLKLLFVTKLHDDEPRETSLLLPGGSMGYWPFLGKTLDFLKPHYSNSMGNFLHQHCLRFGRVFKSHIFGSPAIVSCDLELNMFILQNEEKLFQASYPKAMHGILGKYSLILVSGDLHRKLRNVVVSFVNSSKSSPKFLHCVEELSITMMESWNGLDQVAFFSQAKTFTMSIMVNHLLNIKPGEPRALEILEDFEMYMKGFISLPIYIPGTAYSKAIKARERLSTMVKKIMKERVKNKIKIKGLINKEGEDFLDMILAKQNLSEEEMVSVVLDILLGGYETTATLLSLIVYFLAHSPNTFQKLKEEQQAMRKNKEDGEPLNWEDYKKMEFTYHVICEALRCGNVVKFVHRKALQDVKFKGILIPSGWKVLPIFTGAHFDTFLHDKPHEFNPWRWTDEEMHKKVTPFGGGKRLCPGADLAKVVIGFFLHHLVLNYRWKIKADEVPLAYPYVEFRRGLMLEIEPARDALLEKNQTL